MQGELIEGKGRLTPEGDLIVDSKENGGTTITTVKYGVIKLMGDKTEYRVSYKTLTDIVNRPPKFEGDVIIPELHLKTPIKNIVFQQFRDEEIQTAKDFTNLPVKRVVCEPTQPGERFRPTELSEMEANKSNAKYWLVSMHYTTASNNENLYDCEFSHAKEALLMVPYLEDEGYPPSVSRIFRYGEEQLFGKKKLTN